MNPENFNYLKKDDENISLKKIFQNFYSRWYYFAIFIPLCIFSALIFIQSTPSKYILKGLILVNEDESSNMNASNFLLSSSSIFSNKSNIKNEIGILKSRSLISYTIDKADFLIEYYKTDLLKDVELYNSTPFLVEIDSSSFHITNVPFNVTILSENQFSVEIEAENFHLYHYTKKKEDLNLIEAFSYKDTLEFNKPSEHPYLNFSIIKNDRKKIKNYIGEDFLFVIKRKQQIINEYQEKLEIKPINEEASILEVSIKGNNKDKEIFFLNKHFEAYLERDLYLKNEASKRTIDFIDKQLTEVTESLKGAEQKLENFRTQENFLDLDFSAKQSSDKMQDLEKQEAQLLINDKYFRYLLKYLESNEDINTLVAPSSIGIEDPLLNELIIKLQDLSAKKVSLSFAVNDKNYELNRLNLEIQGIRNTLLENVMSIVKSSEIQIKELQSRINQVNIALQKLPKNERNLVEIQRMFNLNDQLYKYLLEKRAEAGITEASNMPSNQILDTPFSDGNEPIEPKKGLILFISIILGIIIPVIFITVLEAFNDKIKSQEHIEGITDVSVIGTISKSLKNSASISESLTSINAESFRSLYANVQFLTNGNGLHDKKVISFTSSVSGEGKSYCAANLGIFLAKISKKTLIIECDLRKPSLKKYFPKYNEIGLSDYLIGHANLSEIITKLDKEKLDIIFSGTLPPNPAELLASFEFKELLNDLKTTYDYIILDTTPLGIVSDYKMFSNLSNITLYVVRHDYSKESFIVNLEKQYKFGQMKNTSIILNDVPLSIKNKYYGKGYYYDRKKNIKKKDNKVKNIQTKADNIV